MKKWLVTFLLTSLFACSDQHDGLTFNDGPPTKKSSPTFSQPVSNRPYILIVDSYLYPNTYTVDPSRKTAIYAFDPDFTNQKILIANEVSIIQPTIKNNSTTQIIYSDGRTLWKITNKKADQLVSRRISNFRLDTLCEMSSSMPLVVRPNTLPCENSRNYYYINESLGPDDMPIVMNIPHGAPNALPIFDNQGNLIGYKDVISYKFQSDEFASNIRIFDDQGEMRRVWLDVQLASCELIRAFCFKDKSNAYYYYSAATDENPLLFFDQPIFHDTYYNRTYHYDDKTGNFWFLALNGDLMRANFKTRTAAEIIAEKFVELSSSNSFCALVDYDLYVYAHCDTVTNLLNKQTGKISHIDTNANPILSGSFVHGIVGEYVYASDVDLVQYHIPTETYDTIIQNVKLGAPLSESEMYGPKVMAFIDVNNYAYLFDMAQGKVIKKFGPVPGFIPAANGYYKSQGQVYFVDYSLDDPVVKLNY